jgi:parvulin-like peptidyl-prolyl isomerase
VQSRFGYHLLKVTERDPGGQWTDVRHILVAVTPSRADVAATRETAERIRGELAGGALDFVEAIRRHSDDPASRANEGDLGWIPIDSFYGDMRSVADTLRVGRISPPVEGDGGFHVFKILGEQAEGNYTFDEVSDQLKQLAFQQAMQEQLRAWLDELRKKFYVENRARW